MIKKGIQNRNKRDYDKIVKEVANELGLDVSVTKNVFSLYWRFIKDTLSDYPFEDIDTEEDFKKHRYSISMRHIGKIYTNEHNVFRLKNKKKKYGNSFEESDSDSKWSDNNSERRE